MTTRVRERRDSFSIRVAPERWRAWKEVAEATGRSMNAYVIQAVSEFTKYERMNLKDREQQQDAP